MIPADLLDKLREADPDVWDVVVRGIPLIPRGKYMTYDHGEVVAHQYQDAYISFSELMPEVALAWLQACLQAAIRAREWQYTLRWRLKISIIPPTVHVNQSNVVPEIYPRVVYKWVSEAMIEGSVYEGNTEAEALCLAYLAAPQEVDGLGK